MQTFTRSAAALRLVLPDGSRSTLRGRNTCPEQAIDKSHLLGRIGRNHDGKETDLCFTRIEASRDLGEKLVPLRKGHHDVEANITGHLLRDVRDRNAKHNEADREHGKHAWRIFELQRLAVVFEHFRDGFCLRSGEEPEGDTGHDTLANHAFISKLLFGDNGMIAPACSAHDAERTLGFAFRVNFAKLFLEKDEIFLDTNERGR